MEKNRIFVNGVEQDCVDTADVENRMLGAARIMASAILLGDVEAAKLMAIEYQNADREQTLMLCGQGGSA